MTFVPRKPKEITNKQIENLSNNTPITNFGDGSRAQSILEEVNDDIANFETRLDVASKRAFVTKTSGTYLDWIGEGRSCPRLPGESDNNYRYRIINHSFTAANANKTAIRIEALSVDGVKDVKLIPYTFGTGSYSVYVIPKDSSKLGTVVNKVQEVLDSKHSFGVKGRAFSPKMIPVEISVRLTVGTNADTSSLSHSVKEAIRYYFESRDIGEGLVVNALISSIMNVSRNIQDVDIYEIKMHDKLMLVQNQDIHWDEKFALYYDNITVV